MCYEASKTQGKPKSHSILDLKSKLLPFQTSCFSKFYKFCAHAFSFVLNKFPDFLMSVMQTF